MTANEALIQATRGTTSCPIGGFKSHVPKVLYFDGTLLLLKYPSSTHGRVLRQYIPSWVEAYRIHDDGTFAHDGKQVHEGRVTKKMIEQIVANLKG